MGIATHIEWLPEKYKMWVNICLMFDVCMLDVWCNIWVSAITGYYFIGEIWTLTNDNSLNMLQANDYVQCFECTRSIYRMVSENSLRQCTIRRRLGLNWQSIVENLIPRYKLKSLMFYVFGKTDCWYTEPLKWTYWIHFVACMVC